MDERGERASAGTIAPAVNAPPAVASNAATTSSAAGSRWDGPVGRVARALAGPALIVVGVLVVLHAMAFGGRITFTQPDVAALWLPAFSFLGETLRHGAIPYWNPSVMGGLPFAADPQSGWTYLVPMLLFSALPAATAIRWYLVLQPILAGLGIYWFLRAERVSRPAATAGGLVIALTIAGSRLVVDLPFPAALAWSALLLAAAARCLRADGWPARLGWVLLTAIAWGQIAAIHLSHGLVIGTLAFVCYAAARTVVDVRAGRRSVRDRATLLLVLAAAFPLVNIAYFLPRLGYLPSTTLGVGYASIQRLGQQLSGWAVGPKLPGPASPVTWVFALAFSPGAYLGAIALAIAFAGWWSKRLRPLAIAFTVLLGLCYLASLNLIASGLSSVAGHLPFGDVYLQSPWRFRYGVLLALALLAGLGVEAWREEHVWRRRALMLVPGLLVWGVLPWLTRPAVARLALLGIGALVGAAVLLLVAHRPALAALIPLVMAVELVANGLAGQAVGAPTVPDGISGIDARQPPFNALGPIAIPAASYARPDRFVHALREVPGARFITLDPPESTSYIEYTAPADWPALGDQRAMLFGLEDAQGYNSIEPLRYWTYLRAVSAMPYYYNNAAVMDPSSTTLDLLQVGWEVVPRGGRATAGFVPVAREGRWILYRGPAPPRASVVPRWTVTDGAGALRAVTALGFTPEWNAILERSPGLSPRAESRGGGRATFAWTSPTSARITVSSPGDAVVLVRNTYDPHWHATVDGAPAPVLRADYFLQAVPVKAGTHTIVLTYHDTTVKAGLAGSAVVIVAILGTAMLLRRRRRAIPAPEGRTGAEEDV